MSLRFISLAGLALMLAPLTGCAAVAAHHQAYFNQHPNHVSGPQFEDPISGEWNVTFYVHGDKTPATFTFKLDGAKISGTAYSEHTGPGTIRDGKWADGTLSLTLDFAKHQSIVVNGTLKDGKLTGEFSTEGFTDKWEAVKK